MAYRTLQELRADVLSRLGMGAMGAAGGANRPLIDSFLRNAQAQLYRLQDWKHLMDYADLSLGVNQNVLDYPTSGKFSAGGGGCARDKRVIRVEYQYSGRWEKLHEGITTEMWSNMGVAAYPQRYERFAQLQIYPLANQVYPVRVWFIADLAPFAVDGDRASLDDEMVLLHATTNAKAHYRQPDAGQYQGQLNTMLASLRGQSFGSNGVYRRDEEPPAMARPAVVGRDV